MTSLHRERVKAVMGGYGNFGKRGGSLILSHGLTRQKFWPNGFDLFLYVRTQKSYIKRIKIMTFLEFIKRLPDEQAVIDQFIKIRFPKGLRCNHCGSSQVYARKNPKFFDCEECKNTFSVFKDTIFEKSSTDLRKWMYAIQFSQNIVKSISGKQLQREVQVTYKCAWRMRKQIREAKGNNVTIKILEDIVEVNETYIGREPNKYGEDQLKLKCEQGTKKQPIVGVVDRDKSKVHDRGILPTDYKDKQLTRKQLLEILSELIKNRSRP